MINAAGLSRVSNLDQQCYGIQELAAVRLIRAIEAQSKVAVRGLIEFFEFGNGIHKMPVPKNSKGKGAARRRRWQVWLKANGAAAASVKKCLGPTPAGGASWADVVTELFNDGNAAAHDPVPCLIKDGDLLLPVPDDASAQELDLVQCLLNTQVTGGKAVRAGVPPASLDKRQRRESRLAT